MVLIMLLVLLALPRVGEAATPQEVNQITEEVQTKKQRLEELNKKIAEKEADIAEKRAQTVSLKNQLAIIENRIAETELRLDATFTEIDKTALEIKALDLKITTAEQGIARNRGYLASSLRSLQRATERGPIPALLTSPSVSTYFEEIRSLSALQRSVTESLEGIKKNKALLQTENESKSDKRRRLEALRITLDGTKEILGENKSGKKVLVQQTEETARSLAKTLSELRSEQQAIDREITNLESSLRSKLRGNERFKGLGSATGPLRWPVDPSRGITTQFHDPEYPFRYIFEHPGIDIRSYQGNEVRAAASGYIAKVRRPTSPTIYSYILIIHAGGISTVYGHLSAVLASEDQFVQAGDVIGRSGATPGTPGAGRLTTGPHVHFEVRSNGIPVNPLDYMGGL